MTYSERSPVPKPEIQEGISPDKKEKKGTEIVNHLGALRRRDMLSRKQAAHLLGITYDAVRSRERIGLYRPDVMTESGYAYYTQASVKRYQEEIVKEESLGFAYHRVKHSSVPREIDRFLAKRPRYETSTASRMFDLLEAGKNCAEIVIELQIHPTIARAIYEDWIKLKTLDGGGFFVTRHQLEQMDALPLLGSWPISSAQELVENLREASQHTQLCISCNRSAAACCMTCVATGQTPKPKRGGHR